MDTAHEPTVVRQRRVPRARTVLALAAVGAIAAVATGAMSGTREVRGPGDVLAGVFSLVGSRFVDTMSQAQLYERAARGLVRELGDPYSELLSPRDLERFSMTTLGRYGGVGMEVLGVGDSVYVIEVMPGTPSAAAGMQRGDRLVRVGGFTVTGASVDTVVARLRGEPGSLVRVEVEREGVVAPVSTTLRRTVVQRPPVPWTTIIDGVGYVPMPGVTATSGTAVDEALRRLAERGARGAVLDLRGNGGGSVEEAVRAVSNLLPNGSATVAIRERAGTQVLRTESSGQALALPLVVLQDGGTASAAEIIGGALQDHDRALLVGTSSYGKGLAQTLYPLDGGWALKLTTAKWYTPAGRSIHRDRTAGDSARHAAGEATVRMGRTFAGRAIVDSGGIVPDVWVRADTLTTAERDLARRLFATDEAADALNRMAMRLAKPLRAAGDTSFALDPAWRPALRQALGVAKVEVDDRAWQEGARFVDRLIAQRVATFAFGRAAAEKRALLADRQFQVADSLVRQATSARALVMSKG